MNNSVKKFNLWKEIALILIIKVFVILAIWYFCFSDPVEKHLTAAKVAQQFLGNQSHLKG